LFLLLAFVQPAIAQQKWTQTKNIDQIEVYVRDYPGLAIKELKTVATFNCSVQTLVALITDISEQKNYQFGCRRSDLLKRTNRFEQLYYQELYVPWPFENRDGVFKQSVDKLSNEHEAFIYAKSESNFIPKNKSFVRVPFMKAKWHITQINANTCKAEYIIAVDPGGAVPIWLINLFIDKAPLESVRGMRKSLLKEKYQKPIKGF